MSKASEEFKINEEVRVEIEKALVEFEKQAGLPGLQPMEAPACLSMSLQELRKLSPEQLAEASFEIGQYAWYIQRLINKNKSWERWAKSRLGEIAASLLPQIGGHYGFNEREQISKNTHPLCRELNAFMRKIGMEIDRLYNVPNDIRVIGESIRDLRFSAMRREKDYANNNSE
jgi:hypothetical protein